MEMEKESKSSILIFPWLAYSHVFPYLQLAKQLSNKQHFDVYFCSSSINLDLIRTSIDHHQHTSTIHLIPLHVPSSPELPPHLHTTKNLPPRLNPNLLRAFQDSAPSFSRILVALKPDLLIYDFFQPWAPKLARSHDIPSVYFATSGAAAFSFYHHLHTHGAALPFPHPEVYLLDHEKVDLRKAERHAEAHPPVEDAGEGFGFGSFEMSSEVVLIKSSIGIEGKYIDHLSGLCRRKVIPTGPLVVVDNSSSSDECSEISGWLSTKDRSSTVFVCFGSEHLLTRDQILEVAKGLELCEANFVWAVRFPEEEEEEKDVRLEDKLPDGFLERVGGRGRVLSGWASQGEILAHPSIAGFVSHCGWSSVMESLYFGVPIIAMPIKLDQPINARLVAGAGAGVEVKRDDNNGMFLGEEVAKAIGKVVSRESGEGMRSEARSLSEKLKAEEGGAIDVVEDQLLRLCKNHGKI